MAGPRPARGGVDDAVAEPALARLLAAADTVATGGGTHANRHLAPAFLDAVERADRGTRLWSAFPRRAVAPIGRPR